MKQEDAGVVSLTENGRLTGTVDDKQTGQVVQEISE
jgi:hypothetical protein